MKIRTNKAGSHSSPGLTTTHVTFPSPSPAQPRPASPTREFRGNDRSSTPNPVGWGGVGGHKRKTGDTSKHGKSFLPVSARLYFPKSSPQFVTEVSKQVATIATAKLGFDTLSCLSFTQQRCYQF